MEDDDEFDSQEYNNKLNRILGKDEGWDSKVEKTENTYETPSFQTWGDEKDPYEDNFSTYKTEKEEEFPSYDHSYDTFGKKEEKEEIPTYDTSYDRLYQKEEKEEVPSYDTSYESLYEDIEKKEEFEEIPTYDTSYDPFSVEEEPAEPTKRVSVFEEEEKAMEKSKRRKIFESVNVQEIEVAEEAEEFGDDVLDMKQYEVLKYENKMEKKDSGEDEESIRSSIQDRLKRISKQD